MMKNGRSIFILLLLFFLFYPGIIIGKEKPIFIWPLDVEYLTVTQEFGKTSFATKHYKNSKRHWGIDISVGFGAPVMAVADGVIVALGDDICPNFSEPECNYRNGNWIIVYHPLDKIYTFYGHLKEKSHRAINSLVKQGEIIGHEGHSGYHFSITTGEKVDTGSHLHFSVGRFRIYKNFEGKTDFSADPKNPIIFLPSLK